MPRKNVVKTLIPNAYYHVYNRGIDKRTIFTSNKDHQVFLGSLKEYLSPPPKKFGTRTVTINQKQVELPRIPRQNYHQQISLLCYCLMPNHYHLLVKQHQANSLALFMKSLSVRYTMYFNQTQSRQGPLFQSTYKAVLVDTDAQLLHLSRYIHLNPYVRVKPLRQGLTLPKSITSQPSSYPDYLNQQHTPWLDTQTILNYFSTTHPHSDYHTFVTSPAQKSESLINSLTLE